MKIYKVIDVGEAQGSVDMQAVKRSGYDGVIIRAGYGNDPSQTDPYFEKNYENAMATDLMTGVYWFCYARDCNDAIAEAEACNQIIKGKIFPLGIYYDYEEDSIDYMDRCGANKIDMSERIAAWIQQMSSFGWQRVRWYTNKNCINGTHGADALNSDILKPYGLWLAYWTNDENNPITELQGYSLVGHQWSDHQDGEINGVQTVDRDIFYSAALDYTDETTNSYEIHTIQR